jgi:hypothetical protein
MEGRKYIFHVFSQLHHQLPYPYTSQQNGVAEHKHRHNVELALAIMSQTSTYTLSGIKLSPM